MSHLLTSLHYPPATPHKITFTAQRCQPWECFCNSGIWPFGILLFELCQFGSCLKVHQIVRKLVHYSSDIVQIVHYPGHQFAYVSNLQICPHLLQSIWHLLVPIFLTHQCQSILPMSQTPDKKSL